MDGENLRTKSQQEASRAFRVLLVSVPWPPFDRPSIQLAGLHSYLLEHSDYQVEIRHLYLDVAHAIGIDRYNRIAVSGWAGEALFAALLFPEWRERAARLFVSEMKRGSGGGSEDFPSLVAAVRVGCAGWLAGINVGAVGLIGFSVCFNQLLGSLYLVGELKKRGAVATVFGGTACCGAVGTALVEQFGSIDFLVDGEGESPLLALCDYLSGKQELIPAQIRTRNGAGSGARLAEIAALDDLPLPDFKPYLSEVRQLFGAQPFMPTLPVEFSRGCGWHRCVFCNLNLQWHGYRRKSAGRMAAEVMSLSAGSESLRFAFTDNALPGREAGAFFQAVAKEPQDISFFGELRATISLKSLASYRRGGLRSVQVGIESLSSSLLQRMQKGTTVMDNLAVMKYCCALGIRLVGNIITEFPSTTPDEIDDTLLALDYILPYAPLDCAAYFLGFDSYIHRHPAAFGITARHDHPKAKALFPVRFRGLMTVCGYRGDRSRQRRLWQPVRRKIKAWHEFHERRRGRDYPPLSYRDGGRFLIISQELVERTLLHRLRGVSRELYLFCDQPRTMTEIGQAFPGLNQGQIDSFIEDLSVKRLLFREHDRVLALAVHFDPRQ